MDENIVEAEMETDGTGSSDDGGHWDDLAERLGADVSQLESEPESEALPRSVAPSPAVAPTVKKERKEKRPTPPPRSHWQSLAGMLGIRSSKIDEDDQDAIDTSAACNEPLAEVPAPPPTEPVAEAPKKSFWGWRESKPSDPGAKSAEGTGPAEGMGAEESPDDLDEGETADGFGFGLGSAQSMEEDAPKSTLADVNRELGGKYFEPDEEELRKTESQNVLETMFTPSDASFWEDEESADSTLADDAELGADDAELGADDAELGADDAELGAEDAEYGSEDVEYGAEDVEYGAEDVEYGAEDVEYGAEDSDAERLESPDDLDDDNGKDNEDPDENRDGNRGRRRRRRTRQSPEASRSETDSSRDEPSRPDSGDNDSGDNDSGDNDSGDNDSGDNDSGDNDSEKAGTHPRRRRRRRTGRTDRTDRTGSTDRTGRTGRTGRPAEPVAAERSSESDSHGEHDDAASVIDDDEQFGPSDSVLRLEACADLFDEPMQTSAPERSSGSEQQRDETASGDEDKRRRNSIPTWQDAVGVIVQRNVDSRQEGGSSNANGRRRRGGRRRSKPERRPSSES